MSSTPVQSINKSNINKWLKIGLFFFVSGYFVYKTFFAKPIIKTYEECIITKGSIVQETSPQVCVTKSGQRFTQTLEKDSTSLPSLVLEQGWYWRSSSQKMPGTPDDWVFSRNGSRSDCWHKPGRECNFLPSNDQITNTPRMEHFGRIFI